MRLLQPRCPEEPWSRSRRGSCRIAAPTRSASSNPPIFGMSGAVRNGYQKVQMRLTIEGDAPPEVLREIVEQSRSRSAVYDVLTNGIPVEFEVVT
jgi:hypothetical protein